MVRIDQNNNKNAGKESHFHYQDGCFGDALTQPRETSLTGIADRSKVRGVRAQRVFVKGGEESAMPIP